MSRPGMADVAWDVYQELSEGAQEMSMTSDITDCIEEAISKFIKEAEAESKRIDELYGEELDN